MDETPRDDSRSMGLPIRPAEPGKKLTFFGFFRARFVTGLLVSFPLVVTLFFGRFLFDLIDRWADPISRRLFDRPVPGFGAAVFVVGVFLLGVLAHNVIGRRVLQFGERLFARIPVLRAVYTGTREVTRAFAGNRAKSFRRVVLVPFPNENVWAVAFVTTEFEEATPDGPRRVTAVFMPTTPNPTSGPSCRSRPVSRTAPPTITPSSRRPTIRWASRLPSGRIRCRARSLTASTTVSRW